jgi:pyruvate formate lyase activating enzyme
VKIGGFQKTTLIDYPGKVACTIFLSGCNLRCPWCYSKELVLPEEIKKQPEFSEEEIFSFLKKRQGLLQGVVICGGEPTIQKDLFLFISKIKEMGFLVKLDTNGTNPETLKELIKENFIDYVAMDIKLPKEKYQKILGISGDIIEESINILKNSNLEYEFRTTVVPTIHEKKDIIEIAKWISPQDKYFIQNFNSQKTIDQKFENMKGFTQEELLEIKESISPYFKIVEIR